MTDNVFCTVSLPEQANEALTRMQRLGFRPEEVIVATEVSDVEHLMHGEAEFSRSTLIGVGYGFAFGLLMGLAQMAWVGSGPGGSAGVAGLAILNGCAWSLIGSIIGCGGILVSKKIPAEVEHRFAEEVAQSKLLVAVPLHNKSELRDVRATLSELGATNIHFTGGIA